MERTSEGRRVVKEAAYSTSERENFSLQKPNPELLDRIRVVMVGTTHPGNIGAAVRAMKTMGLSRIHLVRPRHFPHPEATAMAAGAEELLATAVVCETLDEALAGCSLAFGASARLRAIPWPVVDPRECGTAVVAAAGRGEEVALVLGREHSGLTNEELERCQRLVNIPSNPDYGSLNVGSAVQVLAYEVRMAWLALTPPEPPAGEPLATAEDMEGFFAHLAQTLAAVGFLKPEEPGYVMRRMRRLFLRARMERHELHILRGILATVLRRIGD